MDPRGGRVRRDRRGLRVRAAVPRPDTSRSAIPGSGSAAREFEREQGVSGIPVSVEDVSDTTSQANAYAVGFGPSRKVVLWSTMVDGSFSDAEVRVVLAHEIGHHSSKHIPKALAWFGLFALPAAWVLMRATRRRGGMGEAAAVPLALLVVAVLELALAPAQALDQPPDGGRGRLEGAADDPRSGGGARGSSSASRRRTSANPDPPAWAHVLLDSHPTLAQRVAMAEAWQARPKLVAPRSTCTRARSRPRAASGGRRGR